MARGVLVARAVPSNPERAPVRGIRFALTACVSACFALTACASYKDTYTPGGIPNFHVFALGMYRTGLPPTPTAWAELRQLVEQPGQRVTKIVLHDDAEGDESTALAFGWTLIKIPLPPEDDKPLTIFVRPNKADVYRAVHAVLDARARGDVVIWGCVHDRDRGGLVSALVGMRMFGWSKATAWRYAISTGLRWELPDLDAYWIEDVPQ